MQTWFSEILPNDTIVLTEVSPVDSGMYECEVSNIDEIRKRDKLIVYSEYLTLSLLITNAGRVGLGLYIAIFK